MAHTLKRPFRNIELCGNGLLRQPIREWLTERLQTAAVCKLVHVTPPGRRCRSLANKGGPCQRLTGESYGLVSPGPAIYRLIRKGEREDARVALPAISPETCHFGLIRKAHAL